MFRVRYLGRAGPAHDATADAGTITDKLGVSDSPTGVERIQFSDAAIALDLLKEMSESAENERD